MFPQESIRVKAITLKEDIPTGEVVVTENVVKGKYTAATSEEDLRKQLLELEVERVEETDKELGRGAYGEEPEYLLRAETHQAKKRQWRKTWKKQLPKLFEVSITITPPCI